MIAFIDIEVGLTNERVADMGAIGDDGAKIHTHSQSSYRSFLERYTHLCGHNIVHHDLTYLQLAKPYTVIDTLYVSPLLFPLRPYHRLLKDDKLQVDDLNNPLNDALKARDLFYDEVEAWRNLPPQRRDIFRRLLAGQSEFRGFINTVEPYIPDLNKLSTATLIRSEYRGLICEHADIDMLASTRPVELAYALAIIGANDLFSLTPAWVLHNYPEINNVMVQLRSTPCGGCDYCNSKLDAHKGLREFFGYDEFRTFGDEPMQQNAVEAALRGESILTIFPTGGGKSLTFQLPALMAGRNTHGLTVVISPLQSLMKDQVDNLQLRGVSDAVTINGLLDPIERATAISQVANGTANMLYIAPEMLRSKTIERLLLCRNVVRFVIDEAHCFSAWGQDFRTDYLYIGDFISRLQKQKRSSIAISCFTATAKPKVISDICDYFKQKLGVDLKIFATTAERKNLHHRVVYAETHDEKYRLMRGLIQTHQCPTIIYVSRTRRTREICDHLGRDGIRALPFNGKMGPDEKVRNQNAFMSGDVSIIVATSAFGMGVDKKDVGLVIHYDISDSLENYIQEAGRAGRDPATEADCYVLYSDSDLDKHFILLNQTKLSMSEIQQVWKAIKTLTAKRDKVSCSALEVARQAGWDGDNGAEIEMRVRSAIAALEQVGFVERGSNAPRVFATGIKVRNMDEARQRLTVSTLFDATTREEAARIIRALISSRATSRSRGAEAESRVDYLADILGLTKESVIRNINLMRQEGLLADTQDMSAFIERASINRMLEEMLRIERYIFERLDGSQTVLSYKQFNTEAQQAGNPRCTVKKLRTVMAFLATKGYVYKEEHTLADSVSLCLQTDKDSTIKRFEKRVDLCRFVAQTLNTMPSATADGDVRKIMFSMVDFLARYNSQALVLPMFEKASLSDMEEALLYLSRIGLVKIEGGFMVVYNAMQLHRKAEMRAHYGKEQYRQFDEFYRQRIQQIHIVGEFANMMVGDYRAALQYVSDYFQMDYRSFINKYFKGERRAQIAKNITPAKYNQIFGVLSQKQRAIIDDKQSRYIVVAAGPGSGKTRVLVHKLASLLLLEDVKHEQLLMLTFSRAAATEFKKRLIDLVGNAAHYVDIKTFHSYAFDLLGRQGSLEEAADVVSRATAMIAGGDVEESRIAKSVLVIDEAQDMSADDFGLVQALMSRNEDMRVIAVGDDDQNIYSFRGSNSVYMRSLIVDHGATLYELTANYRSDRAIVAYANHFVQRIPNRMKSAPIEAVSTNQGVVQEVADPQYTALSSEQSGTTAYLTVSNELAMQLAHHLRMAGRHVCLVQETSQFRFINLAEVRYFFKQLGTTADGVVSRQQWEAAKRRTTEVYATSSLLEVMQRFFADIEATLPTLYRSDLREFALESNIEDFVASDRGTVFVSTIHKAKGREFDNVHLLIGGMQHSDSDWQRAIYVGLTRAKHSLTIYHSQFDLPNSIALPLTMRDVWLDTFRGHKEQVLALRSGDKLQYADGYLSTTQGAAIGSLSMQMRERIAGLETKGYRVVDASVSYILAWRPRDERDEVAICLANLILSKDTAPLP